MTSILNYKIAAIAAVVFIALLFSTMFANAKPQPKTSMGSKVASFWKSIFPKKVHNLEKVSTTWGSKATRNVLSLHDYKRQAGPHVSYPLSVPETPTYTLAPSQSFENNYKHSFPRQLQERKLIQQKPNVTKPSVNANYKRQF